MAREEGGRAGAGLGDEAGADLFSPSVPAEDSGFEI